MQVLTAPLLKYKIQDVTPKVVLRLRDQFGVPAFIHAVHRKNVLGEINSNRDHSHDFLLLVVLMKSRNSIMARLMPFAATSPQPRDGEVPFIR